MSDQNETMGTSKEENEEVPTTFPQKLMEILSDEANIDSISWIPHGRGFMIYKKKKFAADILPKYFKQSKFTSFTRKLNRWGFTRVTRGPESGSYHHKYFLRDQPRLCLRMSCHTTRLTGDNLMNAHSFMSQHHAPFPIGSGASTSIGMPFGRGSTIGTSSGAGMMDQGLLQLQLQMQQAQFQQQQQLEMLRRSMFGGGNGISSSQGQKNDDLLYMQMLAQSKVSAQPLMQSIQNSLMQASFARNQSTGSEPSEPDRPARRASAA